MPNLKIIVSIICVFTAAYVCARPSSESTVCTAAAQTETKQIILPFADNKKISGDIILTTLDGHRTVIENSSIIKVEKDRIYFTRHGREAVAFLHGFRAVSYTPAP